MHESNQKQVMETRDSSKSNRRFTDTVCFFLVVADQVHDCAICQLNLEISGQINLLIDAIPSL